MSLHEVVKIVSDYELNVTLEKAVFHKETIVDGGGRARDRYFRRSFMIYLGFITQCEEALWLMSSNKWFIRRNGGNRNLLLKRLFRNHEIQDLLVHL
jgi:hypothetical protein